MALTRGTRLGPYEIVAPIGAGGMGEVYRARDPRLNREVAIKVLPPELSASEERRQRFEREARSASKLNHPGICTIFDVGREGSVDYLVMELLEGGTLAERLAKGRLGLDQALRFGAEIAAALAAAHARGIVHRDLKPANIMLTDSGIKLLDFGLAGALAPPVTGSVAETAGAGVRLTESGVRLGTAPYMAPEQAEGREMDARVDIFALGAVLFEMATGNRAFGGTSQAAVLSNVLTHEPPAISTLQPAAPQALDRLVRRCLAKQPSARWNSAADLGLQLREIADESAPGGGPAPAPMGAAGRPAWLPWLVALLATAFGIVAIVRRPAPERLAGPAIRFAMAPPESAAFSYQPDSPYLAVSPDGSQLAFIGVDASGASVVWVRPLASIAPRLLPGTENTSSIFWSPDGRSIGCFAGEKLSRVDLASGAATPLCSVPANSGMAGSWGKDEILFSSMLGRDVRSVPVGGGEPRVILSADSARGEWRVGWPYFLPDGKHFLYLIQREDGKDSLRLAAAGERGRSVMACASNAAFTEPDLLTYVQEGSLFARRFDWRTGRLSGGPYPIAAPVRYFLSTDAAAFATSTGGTLAYQSGAGVSELVWLDRKGREVGAIGSPGDYLDLCLSPDGRRLLFSRTEPNIGTYDVWSFDMGRGVETRITAGRNSEFGARWLPGGQSIVYSAVEGGLPLLHRLDLATGKAVSLLPATGFQIANGVSPDGRTVAYTERRARGSISAWTLPLSGGAPSPMFSMGYHVGEVQFSADGRYVALISDESGSYELYLAPYPGPGERTRISRDGAVGVVWPRASGELLYLSGRGDLVSVPVRTAPTLEVGTPTVLFRIAGTRSWVDFDATADGQRILAIIPRIDGGKLPVTVVANWPAGIAR